MALRCGCANEADDLVFGFIHECSKDPDLRYGRQQTLPKLVPSWRFVVPETSVGDEPCVRHNRLPCWSCLKDQPVVPATSEGTYDPDLQEARIHQTLGEDELHD